VPQLTVTSHDPGDVNGDKVVDQTDIVYLLNYLYLGGPAPVPLAAGDVNGDSAIDQRDILYLVRHMYGSGPPVESYAK
jgi:hypothetical protein